jgi:hypothetical protein
MRVSGSFDAMAGFRKEGKESRIYLMLKRAWLRIFDPVFEFRFGII